MPLDPLAPATPRKHHDLVTSHPRRLADFLQQLHDRNAETFTQADLIAATRYSEGTAGYHLFRLVLNGTIHRLRPREYLIVRGLADGQYRYKGIPYTLTRHLLPDIRHYISHASAMELHGLCRPRQALVYVTTTRVIDECIVLGTIFRTVTYRPEHFFGFIEHTLPDGKKVIVSDLERTLIDGLKHSRYCGGVATVLAGTFLRRHQIDVDRLVHYALQLDICTVIRRVGLLLELAGISAPSATQKLQAQVASRSCSYQPMDTSRPKRGPHVPGWYLILNITVDTLRQAVGAAPKPYLELPLDP